MHDPSDRRHHPCCRHGVGHHSDSRRPTGCTVVMARAGAVAGVDVRGAAPGTRETDLLAPAIWWTRCTPCCWPAAAPGGWTPPRAPMRWLQGVGLDVGVGRLPLVPAAVLFDLHVGDMKIRPDAAAGYAACAAASRQAPGRSNVGAGSGAVVGKMFGMQHAMKGGLGTASVTVAGVTVGALIACNAVGDVVDPHRPALAARARPTACGCATPAAPCSQTSRHPRCWPAATPPLASSPPMRSCQVQAQRLAVAGHDGLARHQPRYAMGDGDTVHPGHRRAGATSRHAGAGHHGRRAVAPPPCAPC